MLRYLTGEGGSAAFHKDREPCCTDRRLRLFAVACCYDVRDFCEELFPLVLAAEKFADGEIKESTLRKRWSTRGASYGHSRIYGDDYTGSAATAMAHCADPDLRAGFVAEQCATAFGLHAGGGQAGFRAAKDCAHLRQASLLRCIFGNPYQPPPPVRDFGGLMARDWLLWNSGTVPKVAQRIYADRSWDAMPVMADALEDAGCSDATILGHLRAPGPHARGCFALDLLLG
jgi:hypothetical protein